MKGLFYVAMFALGCFTATEVMAYEVPKDAVIKVFDADGNKIGEMSRSEYKVVKIEKNKKVLAERKENKEYMETHNSVILHGGQGVTGMDNGTNGERYKVEQERGPVGGVTYCRSHNKVGLCATGTTNKTYMGGLKFDF